MKIIKGASPDFKNSRKEILDKIESILINNEISNGKYNLLFEKLFSKISNSKYAISVNSGGTALELALLSINIKNKEVIVPSQTFIASINSIARAGGKPIFCDIDLETGCLDKNEVLKKINKNTKAVLYVHMFGVITNEILEIKKICKKKNIFLIEDAAHAHGGKALKNHVGSIGDIGCFSFYATKIITSGEGGIITTNNKTIRDRLVAIRNHGRNSKTQEFTLLGNNFRLSEFQAIIAYEQTKKLKQFLKHRNKISKIYLKCLKNNKYLSFLKIDRRNLNTFWRFPLYLSPKINRLYLQKIMHSKYNIRINWMYYPLCHKQPIYRHVKVKLPKSDKHIKELILLPTHNDVSIKDAIMICKKINYEIKKIS